MLFIKSYFCLYQFLSAGTTVSLQCVLNSSDTVALCAVAVVSVASDFFCLLDVFERVGFCTGVVSVVSDVSCFRDVFGRVGFCGVDVSVVSVDLCVDFRFVDVSVVSDGVRVDFC